MYEYHMYKNMNNWSVVWSLLRILVLKYSYVTAARQLNHLTRIYTLYELNLTESFIAIWFGALPVTVLWSDISMLSAIKNDPCLYHMAVTFHILINTLAAFWKKLVSYQIQIFQRNKCSAYVSKQYNITYCQNYWFKASFCEGLQTMAHTLFAY